MASAENLKFNLEFKTGDLFECPKTDSLAHCVAKDLKMGKGIAVRFKKDYGKVDYLKSQGKSVGQMTFLEDHGRYIYYLITKEKSNGKPTYESLEKSLILMKKHCSFAKVTNLAMPRIGCGLDKLEWNKVEDILKTVFGNTSMTITIYDLPKETEEKPKEKVESQEN